MKRRNILREFLVYTLFSTSKLLLKGHLVFFISDMRRFFYWRKTRLQKADALQVHIPWMVFDAIDFLRKWIKKDMKVYEYGSGSSTLFFAKLSKSITSIEHHEDWYNSVEKFREKNKIDNIEYQFIPPMPADSETGQCSDPNSYKSCFSEYKGLSFKDYASSIDRYPDDYFDLVVVDGRNRCSCIMHAMRKVKVNGILLVDNADRAYYLQPFPELFDTNKWQMNSYVGHVPYNPASTIETTTLFTKKEQLTP